MFHANLSMILISYKHKVTIVWTPKTVVIMVNKYIETTLFQLRTTMFFPLVNAFS